jgi:hypothetical protein
MISRGKHLFVKEKRHLLIISTIDLKKTVVFQHPYIYLHLLS